MDKIKGKLTFLGSGNMAEAIFKGIISSSLMGAENIICNDKIEDRLSFLSDTYGVQTSLDAKECVSLADVIFISVKPQNVNDLLTLVSENDLKDKLFVSICAGVLSASIESVLGEAKVVRAMPNTPALIGKGFAAVAAGKYATPSDVDLVKNIFKAVGDALEVKEEMLDAVTAISGSGPAYVFYFLESMVAAAKDIGFSEEEAKRAVFATFEGSLALAKKSEDSLELLREKVTSKGGTTEAAIGVMEETKIKDNIALAIMAAKDKSVLLSRG